MKTKICAMAVLVALMAAGCDKEARYACPSCGQALNHPPTIGMFPQGAAFKMKKLDWRHELLPVDSWDDDDGPWIQGGTEG